MSLTKFWENHFLNLKPGWKLQNKRKQNLSSKKYSRVPTLCVDLKISAMLLLKL